MANEITTDANFLGYVSVSGQGYENFWPTHLFNWKMTGVNCATEDYSLGSTSEIAFTFETDMSLEVGQTVKVGTTDYGPLLFTITSVKKKKTLQNRYDVTCSSNSRVPVNPDSVIEKSDLSRLPANYTLEDLALFAGGDSAAWSNIPLTVNRSYVVNQNWWYQGITYRQLYQWCCQLGGIDDAGTLWSESTENLTYSGAFCPTEPDINNCLFFNSSNVKSIDLANYQSPVIDKIWFGNESTDVGFSLGSGEQSLMFPSNPLINPQDTSFLAPLYNKVHALQSYTPMRVETFQNCELGLPPGYHLINGTIYTDAELFALVPQPPYLPNLVSNIYRAIWGVYVSQEGIPRSEGYPNRAEYGRNNLLRQYQLNADESALELTVEHLQEYISQSEPGSILRLATSIDATNSSSFSDYLVVGFDSRGLEVIINNSDDFRVKYYTWEEFAALNSNYPCIYYIIFPMGSGIPDEPSTTSNGSDVVVSSGSVLYLRPYEFSNANNIYTTLENDYVTKTSKSTSSFGNRIWGDETERNGGYYAYDTAQSSTPDMPRAQNKGWNVVIYEGKLLYIKSDTPLEGVHIREEKIAINGKEYTLSRIPISMRIEPGSSLLAGRNFANYFPYTEYEPIVLNLTEYDYVNYVNTPLDSLNHAEINIFCTLWEYLNWPGATHTGWDDTAARPYASTLNVLKSYADQEIGVPVSSLKTMLDTYGAPGMLVQLSTEVNQRWGTTSSNPNETGIFIVHWDDEYLYYLYFEYYPRNPDAEPLEDARLNRTLSNWEDYYYPEYNIVSWDDFNSNCVNNNLNYINCMLLPEDFVPETQPHWNGYYVNPIPITGSNADDGAFNFTAPKLAWNYFDDGEQFTWMSYTDDDRNIYYCPIFNWEASDSGVTLEGTGNQDRRVENSYLSYDLRTTGKYVDINNAISGTEGEISGVTSTIASLNVRVGNVEAAVNNKVDITDYNGTTIINKINAFGVTNKISSSRVNLSGYVQDSELSNYVQTSELSNYVQNSEYTGDEIISRINATGVTSTIDLSRISPIINVFNNDDTYETVTPDTYEYSNISFQIPADKVFTVEVQGYTADTETPTGVVLSDSDSNISILKEVVSTNMPSADRLSMTYVGNPSTDTTYYIWTKAASAATVGISYTGWYM